jgi:hypothetical protein
MKVLTAGFLTALCLLMGPVAMACRVCRPRVQAAIHTPEYTVNLFTLLLPVVALLLLAVGVFYGAAFKQRFTQLASNG